MCFHKLITELWPLTDVEISFPRNILRINLWNLITFCTCIYIDNIWTGINQYSFTYSIMTNINWHITVSFLGDI